MSEKEIIEAACVGIMRGVLSYFDSESNIANETEFERVVGESVTRAVRSATGHKDEQHE